MDEEARQIRKRLLEAQRASMAVQRAQHQAELREERQRRQEARQCEREQRAQRQAERQKVRAEEKASRQLERRNAREAWREKLIMLFLENDDN